MWEIPTQERRGNGYVYSSQHCTDDEALKEASIVHGFEIEPVKSFRFEAGYYKKSWQNNCVLVGLASSFVEPLEATSIGSTIQQIKLVSSYLATFTPDSKKTISEYHRIMDSVMENLVSMVALHYKSDREDTKMWKDCKNLKTPDLLSNLLEIWGERSPEYHDVPSTNFELFGVNHFWHVAQGQGVLNKEAAIIQIEAHNSAQPTEEWNMLYQSQRFTNHLIDHAETLRKLYE
jgi:tryptophan halogenase